MCPMYCFCQFNFIVFLLSCLNDDSITSFYLIYVTVLCNLRPVIFFSFIKNTIFIYLLLIFKLVVDGVKEIDQILKMRPVELKMIQMILKSLFQIC